MDIETWKPWYGYEKEHVFVDNDARMLDASIVCLSWWMWTEVMKNGGTKIMHAKEKMHYKKENVKYFPQKKG